MWSGPEIMTRKTCQIVLNERNERQLKIKNEMGTKTCT